MTSYTSEIVVGSVILGVAAYIVALRSATVKDLRAQLAKKDHDLAMLKSQATNQEMQQAASDLHAKAWGKLWPQSEGTIDNTEISGETGLDNDEEIRGIADKLVVPPNFKYRVLEDIRNLKIALGTSPGQVIEDILVVRDEYNTLRKAMEGDIGRYRSIVLTGHPGIGKSTFLFYLLLHRLERKLPTAVQLDDVYYFIFDEQGAVVHSLDDRDNRLRKCWALADSNDNVLQPCTAFKSLAELVILASSPKPGRWKEWIKQTRGTQYISDLPSVPEIAAIAKELSKRQTQPQNPPLYDPFFTLSLVCKWGPSTRNIIRTMEFVALGQVDPIVDETSGAAARICKNPSDIFEESLGKRMPQGEGSSIIFLRREPGGRLAESQTFIPTPHLLGLLEEQGRQRSNKESLQLFSTLSTHALTRSAAGWIHERSTHERLCTGGDELGIFRGLAEHHMRPSTRLLPGTLAGLKDAEANDSFYWIPSVANFPGVDGVLGDTGGHVYTIQATIANAHTTPVQGIRKVWDQFRQEVRTSRTWHFVIITNSKKDADEYVKVVSKELRGFTLGQGHVQVWGCVYSS